MLMDTPTLTVAHAWNDARKELHFDRSTLIHIYKFFFFINADVNYRQSVKSVNYRSKCSDPEESNPATIRCEVRSTTLSAAYDMARKPSGRAVNADTGLCIGST